MMAQKERFILSATLVEEERTFAYRTGDMRYPFGYTHLIQRMRRTVLLDIIHIH